MEVTATIPPVGVLLIYNNNNHHNTNSCHSTIHITNTISSLDFRTIICIHLTLSKLKTIKKINNFSFHQKTLEHKEKKSLESPNTLILEITMSDVGILQNVSGHASEESQSEAESNIILDVLKISNWIT